MSVQIAEFSNFYNTSYTWEGRIAQMVEQVAVDWEIPGSIPRAAKSKLQFLRNIEFAIFSWQYIDGSRAVVV